MHPFVFAGHINVTSGLRYVFSGTLQDDDGHNGVDSASSPFSLDKMYKLVAVVIIFLATASSSFALNLGKV